MSIACDRQIILRDRYVLLDGNVDVRVDDHLWVRAPRLFADLKTERLVGHKDIRMRYDFANQSEHAWIPDQVRLILRETTEGLDGKSSVALCEVGRDDNTVVSTRLVPSLPSVALAKEGEPDDRHCSAVRHFKTTQEPHSLRLTAQSIDLNWAENSGQLTNVSLTGCNSERPHWLLRANQATIKDEWLTAVGLTGRIGEVPLFYLPMLSLPLNSALAGSSLLPQVSYDAVQGIGVRHRLEYHFTPRTYSALALNWRSRRGAVWHTTFKSSVNNQRRINLRGWYGTDRAGGLDRFTGQTRPETQYWLAGNAFLQDARGDGPLLVFQAHYGSDKRVSEDFFAMPSSRDDCADNVACMRWTDEQQVLDIGFRHALLRRNQFATTLKTRSITQGSEVYQVRRVYYVPQVRWRHAYASTRYPLNGSCEFGGDWSIVRNAQHDIVYDRQQSEYAKESEGLHMGRLWCHGAVNSWVQLPYGQLRLVAQPYVQARARGYAAPREVGGWCAGCDGAVTAVLPSVAIGRVSWVPSLTMQRYDGAPALAAFRLDEHDRCAHGTVMCLNNRFTHRYGNVSLSQSIELGFGQNLPGFYQQQAVAPLRIDFSSRGGTLSWHSVHEYDWHHQRFCHHEIALQAHMGAIALEGGVSHYDPLCAQNADLLFTGGTFVSSGVKWYPNAHWYCWYTSRWAYEHTAQTMRGLHHDVGISYKGHCWELAAGYRENRYVQYGRQRKQCSYYIKLRLCPIGTVGTAFKRWVYE